MKKERYTEEQKAIIIAEYEKGEMGYHLLAKKFRMTRDAIRGIILRNKRSKKPIKIKKVNKMRKTTLNHSDIDLKKLDKKVKRIYQGLASRLCFF